MLLHCIKKNTDFIPMVKTPYFWQSSRTLKDGDDLEVDDLLGHQILATYPGCFEVRSFGNSFADVPKKTDSKRGRPKIDLETKVMEKMEHKAVDDSLDAVVS